MNHQTKKHFGQNFLKDTNLLKKIVREADIKNKNVLEIGPGQGGLTKELVLVAKDVVAYEIDLSLKKFLDSLENECDNLSIIYQDFLKSELKLNEETHLVANVPYYITTPILFTFLETKNLKSATMMIQKEVAERLIAEPSTKAYNALSVLVQYYTTVKKVMDVDRRLFYPVPKVDSIVVRLIKRIEREIPSNDEPLFIEFIKAAFKQKRKTLINNLFEFEKISKDKIKDQLKRAGLNEKVRAEALALQHWIALFEVWKNDR